MADKETGAGGGSAAEEMSGVALEALAEEPGGSVPPPASAVLMTPTAADARAVSEPPESAVALRSQDRSLLAEGEIERIIGLEDPVLRNFLITQCYHELSAALAGVIGDRDVNWSTFATWASKTAGRSIRGEEVPRFVMQALDVEKGLEKYLPSFVHALLERLGVIGGLRHAVLATVRDVSEQVALGNLKVFEELGPVFREFIRVMENGGEPAAIDAFVESLKAGPVEEDGQELLRLAFRDYVLARRATADEERGERMLLGNCRIGLHEQTRLQPHIQAAIEAPVDRIFGEHLVRQLPLYFWGPGAWLLKLSLRGLRREIKETWRVVATRHAMRLALPDGNEISLGEDVPDLPSGVPPALQKLDLPELRELYHRYRDCGAGSAANDWADLADRMGFIVALFRKRQQDLDLFKPPFPPDREQQILQGLIPAEELNDVPPGDPVG
ncbi:MAG: hypothetical protein GX607_12175 [Myxococcales bacterium]|jgi:hypothetical protein|nr:hypothetical protein [Myxococcales bacterium]